MTKSVSSCGNHTITTKSFVQKVPRASRGIIHAISTFQTRSNKRRMTRFWWQLTHNITIHTIRLSLKESGLKICVRMFQFLLDAIWQLIRNPGLVEAGVRPDGTTPFQYLLMFVESVFALIPDHEVRAAKLTDEHLVETKHGLLKCRSVPPGEQWSRRETIEARGTSKWTLEYLDQLWNHVEMKGCRQLRRWKFLQYLRQKSMHLKFEFTATAYLED